MAKIAPQTADPAEYAVIRNVNTRARRAALPALTSARVDTIEISVAPSGMGLGRLLKSSRALLWVGFGGLLAIVLLMAWEGSRVVGVIEGEGNRLRATYQ